MRLSRLVVVTPVALAACASGGGSGSSAASTNAVVPGYTLVATLNPATGPGGNQISGRVRLSPTGKPGELRAEIDLRGGNYQNQFPWVVRSGQCGEPGEDIGTPVNYRLIETKGDGMARISTTVKLTIPEGRTHHVDILAGPSQRALVVSCGVLNIAT